MLGNITIHGTHYSAAMVLFYRVIHFFWIFSLSILIIRHHNNIPKKFKNTAIFILISILKNLIVGILKKEES